MKPCLSCLGDGSIDFRDDDALMYEQFSDRQLALMRQRGLAHPLGVVECPACGGTGLVSDDEWKDRMAAARAAVDQIAAHFNRLNRRRKGGEARPH